MRNRSDAHRPGLIDTLALLAADMVQDARRRVLEEGWFGRPVTGRDRFDDYVQGLYGREYARSAEDHLLEVDR